MLFGYPPTSLMRYILQKSLIAKMLERQFLQLPPWECARPRARRCAFGDFLLVAYGSESGRDPRDHSDSAGNLRNKSRSERRRPCRH